MGTRNLQDTPSSKAAKDVQQVRLHPEADAILVVQGDTASELPRKELLVSSEVLMAASDYFRALFRSGFKEGVETRREDCPTIVMAEDDPKAMHILLSILHYRDLEVYDSLHPETLATVAICSDKYDCTRALRPWISQWLPHETEASNADEAGLLLVAAYYFRSPERFKHICARRVRHARTDFASA
jgi:hypothetical protein